MGSIPNPTRGSKTTVGPDSDNSTTSGTSGSESLDPEQSEELPSSPNTQKPSIKSKWRTGIVLNIEGLYPSKKRFKVNYLASLCQLYNSEYICITESHLNEDIFDAEVTIKDFNMFRHARTKRSRGGVLIYVKDNIISKC